MAELRVIIPEDVDRYLDSVIRAGMFGSKAELARAAIVHFLNTVGPVSRGYDSNNLFSPDGRIFQLEYARESVGRGVPVMGMVCDDGVLLASENPDSGAASLAVSNSNIMRISEKLLVGYSGLAVDAMLVMEKLRELGPGSEEQVLSAVRGIYWNHTMKRDSRPLGAGLLIAMAFGRPRLFEVGPDGNITEYVASVIGRGGDNAKNRLTGKYERQNLKDAGRLVQEILGEGKEYTVEILTVN